MPLLSRRTSVTPAAKHADILRREYQETVDAYFDALDVHATEASERHDHVNARLADLESESSALTELREKIAKA